MNGRLYDPVLGRFLTPDPYITQPQDLQNYNRYSYVDNNPLSATDPSGYKKFWRQKWFKAAVIAVAAVYTGGAAAAAYMGSSAAASVSIATASSISVTAQAAIVGGMASGAVMGAASGQGINGIARGALYGGLSGGLSYGIGNLQPTLGTFGTATAHGVAQGTLSYAQSGEFSAGFASGFTGKLTEDYGLAGSMVSGGIASEVAGGSFADGAFQAGMVHTFNYEFHQAEYTGAPDLPVESVCPECYAYLIGRGGITLMRAMTATKVVRDPFRNGRTPKASELADYAKSKGLKASQTENGPLKYKDENGIDRITIKQGSSRAPGSDGPHVELKDATGQRVDPSGNPVSRRSPGNHTPIDYDL